MIIKLSNVSKEYYSKKASGFMGILKKERETIEAVKNISFEIDEGEIVGYIGKNGAGKSTTIKMLTGIIPATSGKLSVDGLDPYQNRKKLAQNMGIVFGQRSQLYWDLTIWDTLCLLQRIYNIDNINFKKSVSLFNEVLGLEDILKRPVRQLSLGQRMKGDIAAALIHKPKILYLDEPTIGLDIEVKEQIREFINEINRVDRVTVLLTTHDMTDIEKLSSRIIFIDNGQVCFNGNMKNLEVKYGKIVNINIVTKNNLKLPKELQDNLFDFNKISLNEAKVSFDTNKIDPSRIITLLLNEGNQLIDFSINSETSEELIRKLYKSNIERR